MFTDGQILILVIGVIGLLMTLLSIAVVKTGSDADDSDRLNRLTDEGRKKFPTLPYREMIECMRWQRHLELKNTSDGDKEKIAELAEDYLVLFDEHERLNDIEAQLGGEFAVHKSFINN